jgi:hypothetical protein
MDNAKLNRRAMVVYFLFFSALILPISGILLHSTHENGSEKLEFISMASHNIAAVIFTISSVIHVKYNWRTILKYLKNKKDHVVKFPKEIVIAGTTMVFLLVLSIMHILQNH